MIVWLSAALFDIRMHLRHVLGAEIAQETVHYSVRGVIVFNAAIMGRAISDWFNRLCHSRQQALKD